MDTAAETGTEPAAAAMDSTRIADGSRQVCATHSREGSADEAATAGFDTKTTESRDQKRLGREHEVIAAIGRWDRETVGHRVQIGQAEHRASQAVAAAAAAEAAAAAATEEEKDEIAADTTAIVVADTAAIVAVDTAATLEDTATIAAAAAATAVAATDMATIAAAIANRAPISDAIDSSRVTAERRHPQRG